jgi:FkbM family methyltransferase
MPDLISIIPNPIKMCVRRFLIPMVRTYVRYSPTTVLKASIYCRFGWMNHQFTAKTQFGAILSGNSEDSIQSHLYYFGIWEPYLTTWLQQSLGNGDIFIDCGANIGYFSLLASQLVGSSGKVIAVEASPSICNVLVEHIRRNNKASITVEPVALGRERGETMVFLGPNANIGSTYVHSGAGGRGEARVAVLPLVDVITRSDRCRVRFIKIDVEGAEAEVLAGIGDLSDFSHPDLEILVEVSRQSSHVLDQLQSAGLYPYIMPNDYSDLTPYVTPPRDVSLNRLHGRIDQQVDLLFSRRDAECLSPRVSRR